MKLAITAGLLQILLCVALSQAENAHQDSAERAAREWLTLVDSAQYDASYKEAASVFRSKVSESQWTAAVSGVRASLGQVVSRTLTSASKAEKLPGAPEGDYVILQFQTHFENRLVSTETVTPMLDDGIWRVSGYFVK